MTSQAYEDRPKRIFKEMCSPDDEPNTVKVISFFCKRESNQPEVSGVVMKPPETRYELVCELNKVIALLEDKLFTKSRTLRKSMLDLKDYQIYDYAALMHYLEQAKNEGCKRVLISKREFAMIQKSIKK